MTKEITALAPASMKIKIVAPPERKYKFFEHYPGPGVGWAWSYLWKTAGSRTLQL
jgi:hypothetical protein